MLAGEVSLVKSKQRVADHGEVFTPAWLVEAMLDLVQDETERIDSRFLESACGSGNFLVQILRCKLAAVEVKYGSSDFERAQMSTMSAECSLFASVPKHEVFRPVRSYPPMSIADLAAAGDPR